jgi:hypothetical protein
MSKGALYNFIFDCGSWNEVLATREFTTIRSDLAAVAYTGDIADLIQKNP